MLEASDYHQYIINFHYVNVRSYGRPPKTGKTHHAASAEHQPEIIVKIVARGSDGKK